MFETAMKLLHLTYEDKKRIIMVGNNLERYCGCQPFWDYFCIYQMESAVSDGAEK